MTLGARFDTGCLVFDEGNAASTTDGLQVMPRIDLVSTERVKVTMVLRGKGLEQEDTNGCVLDVPPQLKSTKWRVSLTPYCNAEPVARVFGVRATRRRAAESSPSSATTATDTLSPGRTARLG